MHRLREERVHIYILYILYYDHFMSTKKYQKNAELPHTAVIQADDYTISPGYLQHE